MKSEKKYAVISHRWAQGFQVDQPQEGEDPDEFWERQSKMYCSVLFETTDGKDWKIKKKKGVGAIDKIMLARKDFLPQETGLVEPRYAVISHRWAKGFHTEEAPEGEDIDQFWSKQSKKYSSVLFESHNEGKEWRVARKQGVGAIEKILKSSDQLLPKAREASRQMRFSHVEEPAALTRDINSLVATSFTIPWWISSRELIGLRKLLYPLLENFSYSFMDIIIRYCIAFPNINKLMETIGSKEQVDFSSTEITDHASDALGYYLSVNTTLKELILDGKTVSDVAAQNLSDGIQTNTTLEKITLNGEIPLAKFRDENVQNLNVAAKGYKDNDVIIVAKMLEFNTTLGKLDFNGNSIGDVGCKALAASLTSNTTLLHLDLTGNQIGDSGTEALVVGLNINSTLTSLNLSRNRIGDPGAEFIAGGLQINSTLKNLRLHNNQIGDRGAEAISEGLKTNSTLCELHIWKNMIGNSGAICIGEGLKINKTIKSLLMNLNLFDESVKKELKRIHKSHPSLKDFRYI